MAFSKTIKALLLGALLLWHRAPVQAQMWSVPGKSLDLQMATIVYIETVYAKPIATMGLPDTLRGTGFLIIDSDKVYLVTAKHLVTAQLIGKDQRRATRSICISPSWLKTVKGYTLKGLDGKDTNKQRFVFSSDLQDIAVISLQRYPAILSGLLKHECRPLPVDSIDLKDDRYSGETYYHPTYMAVLNKNGERALIKGLAPGKIKKFDNRQSVYTVDDYIRNSSSGSPLYIDNKVIGMVQNLVGNTSNADVVKDPYRSARTGTVVRASLIIPLLRKLQAKEQALVVSGK